MNRYIDRYTIGMLLTLAMLFTNSGFVNAQVKLEGSDKATAGSLNKIRVKIEKGKDLKAYVFKNGEANDTDWLIMKELDDTPVILLQPPAYLPDGTKLKSAVYTVVVGVNDAGKTHMDTKVVKLGTPPPPPKVPDDDEPEPDTPEPQSLLAKEVVNLYKVNPDPATRDKLISAFQEVKAAVPTLKSFGDYETKIASSVQARITGRSQLVTVRDRLGAHILDKTGPDPRRWDEKVAKAATEDVLQALEACK